MFGNKSMPSKRYKYGAKAPNDVKAAMDQIYLAHEYGNKLVEVELRRRTEYTEARRAIFPDMESVEQEISGLVEQIANLRKQITDNNQKTRRKSVDPGIRSEIKRLSAELKLVRASRKEMCEQAKSNEELKLAAEVIEKKAQEAIKDLYGVYTKRGLYWGTLNMATSRRVKRSSKPPRFRRFDGQGELAVQIQGGMTFEELLEGKSNFVRVEGLTKDSWEGKPADTKGLVKLRIGSDEKRQPIWLELPFKMHRPLPDDCRIKWVTVNAVKIATHLKWNVQFVVSKEEWDAPKSATAGRVALDVGWRWVGNGLRVACWHGSDGRSGEIIIPAESVARWQKVYDLQQIRANEFNSVLAALRLWLQDKKLPESLQKKFEHISRWKSQSQSRLAAAVINWRANRFDGDEAMFAYVESWRKQDRHLYDWQEHQRKGNIRWRNNFYREQILELRKQYAEIGVEDVPWDELQKRKMPEDFDKEISTKNRAIAAVGELVSIIEESGVTVRLAAKNSSKKCNYCKNVCELDGEQRHTCEKCEREWDRDHNACRNLVEDWCERVGEKMPLAS